MAIDIYEHCGKLFGSPLYLHYRRSVLPLALQFYSTIQPSTLKAVSKELKRYMQLSPSREKVMVGKEGVVLRESKKEYVKYYEREMIEYGNVVEGYGEDFYYL